MKILQVTPYYVPELQFGGPPQKIHGLSRALAERGHEVEVLTFSSEHPHGHPSIVLDGITIHYMPWRGTGLYRVPLSLAQMNRAVAWADVVHCYTLYNLLVPLAALIAWRRRRPMLLEPVGMYPPRGTNTLVKGIYHRTITAPLVHAATRVIATSDLEQQDLARIVPRQRLEMRRNGIDVDLYRTLPDGHDFRTQHGIADDEILLLFLGRVSAIKNLEALIRAFHRLSIPGARLVIAGPLHEVDYVGRLQAVCEELGTGRNIVFAGPVYQQFKLQALAAASALVLPSVSESYGNAAAEAIAAGLPVLVTSTCGIAPAVTEELGVVAEPTEEGLSEALQRLLPRVGRRIPQESVLEQISWSAPAERAIALYTEVVSPPPTGELRNSPRTVEDGHRTKESMQ